MDYSNFGPGFNAVVAEAAKYILVRWTLDNVSGVSEVELETLIEECIQSLHLAGGTVYRQFCGSPSGAAITTIINSLVNLLYLFIAWILLCDPDLNNTTLWEDFRQNVFICVYGDDVIGSVSTKFRDKYNGAKITELFAQYNIAATDAINKQDKIEPHISIYQSEFLKRGFLDHPERPGFVLAPLRWRSVNDATQWIWSGPNACEATYINCEAALMEAHGHGRQKFYDFRRLVNAALARKHVRPVLLEWDILDQMWFDVGLDPIITKNDINYDYNY